MSLPAVLFTTGAICICIVLGHAVVLFSLLRAKFQLAQLRHCLDLTESRLMYLWTCILFDPQMASCTTRPVTALFYRPRSLFKLRATIIARLYQHLSNIGSFNRSAPAVEGDEIVLPEGSGMIKTRTQATKRVANKLPANLGHDGGQKFVDGPCDLAHDGRCGLRTPVMGLLDLAVHAKITHGVTYELLEVQALFIVELGIRSARGISRPAIRSRFSPVLPLLLLVRSLIQYRLVPTQSHPQYQFYFSRPRPQFMPVSQKRLVAQGSARRCGLSRCYWVF